LHAMQALSQLSYTPKSTSISLVIYLRHQRGAIIMMVRTIVNDFHQNF
jgi:hypothetical protein